MRHVNRDGAWRDPVDDLGGQSTGKVVAVRRRRIGVRRVLMMQERVVEADLERVRARHVAQRRAVVDVPVPRVVELVGGPIGQTAASHWIRVVGDRRQPGNNGVDVFAFARLQVHAAPPLDAMDAANLDQHLVGERHRPVSGDKALEREPAIARAVRRRGGTHAERAAAVGLLVDGHSELVLLVQLIREPALKHCLVLVGDRLCARADVGELVGPVDILVEELVADQVVGKDVLSGDEEPQPVADEGAAHPGVDFAVGQDRAGRGEPSLLQAAACVVVAGEPLAGERAGERAAEPIAAVARDEVHAHAAGGRLRVHAGDVDRVLRRARRVGHGAATPSAGNAGAERHAVHHHPLVARPAAVGGKRRHFRDHGATDVASAEALANAGNQHAHREGRARARDCRDHLLVYDHLTRCRLHVDGRRFTDNGDGFLEGADLQIDAQRRGGGAGELHPFALDACEPGERERDGVLARPQVDDLIPAVAVSDGTADFFDEHRARGFNRHARQD